MKKIKSKSKSKGTSLVELMIAMTIGLFLVIAVTSIYLVVKKNFIGSSSITSTQETYRLVLNNISRSIQTTGYVINPFKETQETVFTANPLFPSDGQFIYGTENNPKSFSVRYQTSSGDSVLNCNGASNETGANGIFTNTFALEGNTLTCSSSFNNGPAIKTNVAENIAELNILYGFDSNNDQKIDSYINAASIEANSWKNVYSVRLAIKFIDTSDSKNNAMANYYIQYINLMNKIS